MHPEPMTPMELKFGKFYKAFNDIKYKSTLGQLFLKAMSNLVRKYLSQRALKYQMKTAILGFSNNSFCCFLCGGNII